MKGMGGGGRVGPALSTAAPTTSSSSCVTSSVGVTGAGLQQRPVHNNSQQERQFGTWLYLARRESSMPGLQSNPASCASSASSRASSDWSSVMSSAPAASPSSSLVATTAGDVSDRTDSVEPGGTGGAAPAVCRDSGGFWADCKGSSGSRAGRSEDSACGGRLGFWVSSRIRPELL